MNTVSKMLNAYGYNSFLSYDNFVDIYKRNAVSNGYLKQWLSGILPFQILERSLKECVESIVSLCECTTFYNSFPEDVKTPDYGDKWGRLANYIEINNRAIAEMRG